MSLTENLFIFDDKTSISFLAFFRFLMSSLLFPKIKKQYNQANRLHIHDFIMNSVSLATTVKLGCDAFFLFPWNYKNQINELYDTLVKN